MSIIEFVQSQNSEPQSMLLSLVPNNKIRFHGGKQKEDLSNETPFHVTNLRPKFVSVLLELIQERHGKGKVDPDCGMVTDGKTRDLIMKEFDAFCEPENASLWFPCPRPIRIYCEEVLFFKLVVGIKDLSPGDGLDAFQLKLQAPGSKRKLVDVEAEVEAEVEEREEINEEITNFVLVPPNVSKDSENFDSPSFSVLDDIMKCFVHFMYYYHCWDNREDHSVAFRAWSMNSPCLKDLDTSKGSHFVGFAASVMCMEEELLPAIQRFQEWMAKKQPVLSRRVVLHHPQDYKDTGNKTPPLHTEEDKMIFQVLAKSSSISEGKNLERVSQMHGMSYYPIKNLLHKEGERKTEFNTAIQFIDLSRAF
eukprot:757588-Hanusia_phi.AAC.7